LISSEEAIKHTEAWIKKVVIDCRFCPFAAAPVKQNTVRYVATNLVDTASLLKFILEECAYLDAHENTETTFVIFPEAFPFFYDYLEFLALAEKDARKLGYEGVYQLAGFHPSYLFAGSDENDAANYTNRSIYPMIHLLREASIDEALKNYAEPESIPDRNIAFAQEKGVVYMKMLRDSIANK